MIAVGREVRSGGALVEVPALKSVSKNAKPAHVGICGFLCFSPHIFGWRDS